MNILGMEALISQSHDHSALNVFCTHSNTLSLTGVGLVSFCLKKKTNDEAMPTIGMNGDRNFGLGRPFCLELNSQFLSGYDYISG